MRLAAILALGLLACTAAGAEDASSSSALSGATHRARVAHTEGATYSLEEVALPAEEGGPLRDALVTIDGVPADVVPDANGCYCFAPTDDRFVYAHAFHWVHAELVSVNAALAQSGLPRVDGIHVKLTRGPAGDTPSNGSTASTGRTSEILFTDPVVDPGLIVHEVGHAIHNAVRPMLPGAAFDPLNIRELHANMIEMLVLGRTKHAEYDLLDGAYDMEQAGLRLPDHVDTLADTVRRWSASPRLAARRPGWIQTLVGQLSTIAAEGDLDAYANGALVARPFLAAARASQPDVALSVWLKSIAAVPTAAPLKTLAPVLLANAAAMGAPAQALLRSGLVEGGVLSP